MSDLIDEIILIQHGLRGAGLTELVALLSAVRFELVSRALPGAPDLAEAINTLHRFQALQKEQARAARPPV